MVGHGAGTRLAPRASSEFLHGGTGSKTVLDGPGADFGYQSAGVKAGPLVDPRSTYADPKNQGGNAQKEAEDILAKIDTILKNGGTGVENLLRLRALVTDPKDAAGVFAALKKAVPKDPPSVCIAVVPGPLLHLQPPSIALDGVAFTES